jgi:hypothetical protein
MADKNRITHWVLNHKNQTQPVYTQYDWPDTYLSGIYDFSASIEMRGIKAEGRGLAANPELAIEKASAEAVERWICKALNIPSVGVAVSGEKSARVHAEYEALERYYLKEHIRLDIPFNLTSTEDISSHQTLLSLLRQFNAQNKETKVSFFRMNISEGRFGVICSIIDDNSSVFGFSLTANLESALQKSFFEALPNYEAMKNPDYHKLTDLPWHLQNSFVYKIAPLLVPDNKNLEVKSFTFKQPKLEIEKIDISQFAELNDCPIEPVRVHILEAVND